MFVSSIGFSILCSDWLVTTFLNNSSNLNQQNQFSIIGRYIEGIIEEIVDVIERFVEERSSYAGKQLKMIMNDNLKISKSKSTQNNNKNNNNNNNNNNPDQFSTINQETKHQPRKLTKSTKEHIDNNSNERKVHFEQPKEDADNNNNNNNDTGNNNNIGDDDDCNNNNNNSIISKLSPNDKAIFDSKTIKKLLLNRKRSMNINTHVNLSYYRDLLISRYRNNSPFFSYSDSVYTHHPLFVLFFGFLLYYSYLTVQHRNLDWQSELTLYESALAVCPYSLKALSNTAMLYTGRATGAIPGTLTRASTTFESLHNYESIQSIDNPKDYFLEKSIHHAYEAFSVYPNNSVVYMNLGIAYYRQENYPLALEAMERALLLIDQHHSRKQFNNDVNLGTMNLPIGKAIGYHACILNDFVRNLPYIVQQHVSQLQQSTSTATQTTAIVRSIYDSPITKFQVIQSKMYEIALDEGLHAIQAGFVSPLMLFQTGSIAYHLERYPLAVELYELCLNYSLAFEEKQAAAGGTLPVEDHVHLEHVFNQLALSLTQMNEMNKAAAYFDHALNLFQHKKLKNYVNMAQDIFQELLASSQGGGVIVDFYPAVWIMLAADTQYMAFVANYALTLKGMSKFKEAREVIGQYIREVDRYYQIYQQEYQQLVPNSSNQSLQQENAKCEFVLSPVLWNNLGRIEFDEGSYTLALEYYKRGLQDSQRYQQLLLTIQEYASGLVTTFHWDFNTAIPVELESTLQNNIKEVEEIINRQQQQQRQHPMKK
jgi:tetratricopeptide (TPR) repeat protein